MAQSKPGRFFKRLLMLIVAVGIAALGLAWFRIGPEPEATLTPSLPGLGKRTPIAIEVREPERGVSLVRVELIQGKRVWPLAERRHDPLPFWKFWGPRTGTEQLSIEVGRETVEGLEEGQATVRVTAGRAGSFLRRPDPVIREILLPVKLRPPTLQVVSTHTYVTQGGCEAVVYRAGESAVTDGVEAGDWFFPGYPLPGGGDRDRFALFAAPYDMDDGTGLKLIAEDDVGNRAEVSFVDQFTPRAMKHDNITVSDGFLSRVVPAILAQTPEIKDRGDLLENYLQINGELRKENAQTLIELSRGSAEQFLWSKRFLQLPNSKVTSTFADRRTYLYQGREVDRQEHLGFDLASVSRAEIPAANDGVVLLARYLGIYGNTVVVDHGYGLQSLYGHLSSLAVEEGQTVKRGEVLGRTGVTGLAGGDHLHFTLLLHGLPVNPTEWWDPRWIRNRIALKIGPAFRYED